MTAPAKQNWRSRLNELLGPMNGSGHEFDLAVVKDSRRESLARHPLDSWPIREKILLGERLGRKLGLQNAALPHVPVRDLKGYRLRPLDDLLLGGLGNYPHPLVLCDWARPLGPTSTAAPWSVSYTGSRQENASNKNRASVLIQSEPKLWLLGNERRTISQG
jgi:hypothetical protein